MASVVEFGRVRPQVVMLAAIAVGIAGCSSEASRFNGDPYAARTTSPEATGSVAAVPPSGRIEQSQLAPPPGVSRPPVPEGIVGGGRGMASYQPVTFVPPEPIGSTPHQQASQWSWDGGTAVIVAPGETIDAIAQRHGVPASAIMQANNLTSVSVVRPGQRLVVPRYNASAATGAPASAPRPAPVASLPPASAPAGASGAHVVGPGETLSKISRTYGRSVSDIAKANNLEPHATLKVGDRIVIPGGRPGNATGKSTPKVAKPLAAPPAKTTPAKVAPAPQQTEQPQQAAVVAPSNEAPVSATAAGKSSDATPTFRWPVKGRVIVAFGPKPNGQQNDGINLAVPEGTPIKAAEDGVVAYAGNELKGYGNLVLIRHANGYVTAYAHAKELLVNRGDQIKRGQVIAKAGQTGNVDAPQLHFEVRKGPSPLDPMPLLAGG